MAVTRLWKVTDRLDRVIDYAEDEEKHASRNFPTPNGNPSKMCWSTPRTKKKRSSNIL